MKWLLLLLYGYVICQTEAFLGFSAKRITERRSSSTVPNRKGSNDESHRHGSSIRQSLRMAIKDMPTTSFNLPNRHRRTKHKDTVIVGAGLAGLSVALYLSQLDPDRKITIVDRQDHDIEAKKKTTIASFAAAGMLAPQSERLPKGHLLNICLASRRMYPEFCELVESLAKESGEEGANYLLPNKDDPNMDPWSVGYMASGGFLAPAFAGDSVATWSPPDDGGAATWLDEIQVRELEPNLHEDVIGGWWFPEDTSVDARRLTCSLYAACVGAGIEFLCGKNYEVTSLDLTDGECRGLWLKNGNYFKTKSVLVANGAWMRNLLPVPIEPHKGQSLSLKMPKDRPPILRRVLFAQDAYIVPKEDGNIVIGATVEAGSFDGNVTPAGLLHILTHALQLVPGLKDLPLEETWAGLRPTTPDKGPILGKSPWKNLFLAGGYWRNGVLLAPKTAQLIASLISGTELTEGDEALLHAFSWDRFTEKGGGAKLAANARYAASMHPIHTRKSGSGVAAAVGTELGTYSTAKKSREERERDRKALSYEGSEESFERAAAMGTRDGSAFIFGDDDDDYDDDNHRQHDDNAGELSGKSAQTVAQASSESTTEDLQHSEAEVESSDVASVYESIRANKAKQGMNLPEEESSSNKPDPGFRVFHIDSKTGDSREVPPYTAPGDFLQSISHRKAQPADSVSASPQADQGDINNVDVYSAEAQDESGYSERTYDGYQVIQQANAGRTRKEELELMRKARVRNRLGQSSIDESLIGAKKVDDIDEITNTGKVETAMESSGAEGNPDKSDISSTYEVIKENKTKRKMSLPEGGSMEYKEDPGFRIFHIDSTTGESREVPPYTSPGEFLKSIAGKEEDTKSNAAHHESSEREKMTFEHTGINGSELANGKSEYDEKTYDGYQIIQEANSADTREEELEKMRRARQNNRLGQTAIDDFEAA